MAYLPVEEENYARMSLLLTGISSSAVRTKFDYEFAPACLYDSLKKEFNKLLNLKSGGKIDQSQWNLLFPRCPGVPDSKKFDVTLMITLLRNLTLMTPPLCGFDSLPSSMETTPVADLARIKHYRNHLAHLNDDKVDVTFFNKAWDDIASAIIRLGGQQMKQDCDRMKVKPLDQTNHEIMRDINHSNTEIRELKESVESIKQSHTEMVQSHEILLKKHALLTKDMEEMKISQKAKVPENIGDYYAVMDTREDNLIDRLRHFFFSIVMEIIHVYLEREVLDRTSLYDFLGQYKHQLFHEYLPTVFCCQCYSGTPFKPTYKSARLSKSQFSFLYACSTENEFCFEKRDKIRRKEHCICKFDPKNVRVLHLDIHLVLAIINICFMHGPRKPPGHPKWLQEIKEVRNFLVHNGDQSCLSKADFEDKWQLLETNSLLIAHISGDSYMLAVQNRILSCKNETNVRLSLKELNIIKK